MNMNLAIKIVAILHNILAHNKLNYDISRKTNSYINFWYYKTTVNRKHTKLFLME